MTAWFRKEEPEDTKTRFGPSRKTFEEDRIMSKKTGGIDSSFGDFLKDEGIYEETTATAIKRVLAWQLQEAMATRQMGKNQMAKEMQTSRSQLDRILDPDNDRIQLDTVIKAARVLGREVRIELV